MYVGSFAVYGLGPTCESTCVVSGLSGQDLELHSLLHGYVGEDILSPIQLFTPEEDRCNNLLVSCGWQNPGSAEDGGPITGEGDKERWSLGDLTGPAQVGPGDEDDGA